MNHPRPEGGALEEYPSDEKPGWTVFSYAAYSYLHDHAEDWLNENAGSFDGEWEYEGFAWYYGDGWYKKYYAIKDPRVAFWFKMTFG